MKAPDGTDWFELALSHSSWAHENGGRDNERLEFLGDAILEQLVSLRLFTHFSAAPEGELSRIRARLVSTRTLAQICRKMGLNERVRLGRGEENSGGRERDRLLAGLFEAWLAATYLAHGEGVAMQLIDEHIVPEFDTAARSRDPKQLLQEWAQRRGGSPPVYEVVDSTGPDHARRFCVAVFIDEQEYGRAWGSSKRDASGHASAAAVSRLGVRVNTEAPGE